MLAGGHGTPCDPSETYSVGENSDSSVSSDLLICRSKDVNKTGLESWLKSEDFQTMQVGSALH